MTFSVAAVVLGAGHGEAIAETIHLFGIDGVDGEAALNERLDHRPVRDFDGDKDLIGHRGAARRHEPGGQLGQPLAAMGEGSFADLAAFAVGEEDAVALASPVDAGIPSSLIVHPPSSSSRSSRRNPRRSLYWRSEQQGRIRRELPTGRRSRPIRRGAHPPQAIASQGATGCSRRTGSVPERYAKTSARRCSCCVPLRVTSHEQRFAFHEPREKGTGGPCEAWWRGRRLPIPPVCKSL